MIWMVRFCNWFRHELSSTDFVWNILMLAYTDGGWIFIMMIYYAIAHRKMEE